MQITENGSYSINGITKGKQYALVTSGTFASATVTAQYAIAEPARATLTLDDDQAAEAIVLTATDGGVQGNSVFVALLDPAAADAELSYVQDGRIFDISLATDSGDAATVAIGTGANGTVTVTNDVAGTAGNLVDIIVVAGSGNNKAMTASISGAFARKRIIVTLGTGAGGAADNAKNTATLIAAAINALDGFSATASGTGADPVATQNVEAFTGGGANASVTTTVGELLLFINNDIKITRHFTAALAENADDEAIIATVAETALAGGTDGTFQGYSTAVSFSAAGDKTARNVGLTDTINLLVASATESTDITVHAIEIES